MTRTERKRENQVTANNINMHEPSGTYRLKGHVLVVKDNIIIFFFRSQIRDLGSLIIRPVEECWRCGSGPPGLALAGRRDRLLGCCCHTAAAAAGGALREQRVGARLCHSRRRGRQGIRRSG